MTIHKYCSIMTGSPLPALWQMYEHMPGRFGITDMYSGGFYPFPDAETFWAWWARHIYFNRYVDAPKPVYKQLLELVKDKDYFVITTNVDHQFQRAGFSILLCKTGTSSGTPHKHMELEYQRIRRYRK